MLCALFLLAFAKCLKIKFQELKCPPGPRPLETTNSLYLIREWASPSCAFATQDDEEVSHSPGLELRTPARQPYWATTPIPSGCPVLKLCKINDTINEIVYYNQYSSRGNQRFHLIIIFKPAIYREMFSSFLLIIVVQLNPHIDRFKMERVCSLCR